MNMKITAHEVLLLQAAITELIATGHDRRSNLLQTAVNEFAAAIKVKVDAGDYWLTKTLIDVEALNRKLRIAADPYQGIGEAA